MKPILVTAFLLSATFTLHAQERPLSIGVPKVQAIPRIDTSKLDQYRQWLEAKRMTRGGLINATFSHNTPGGKVYTLSPDNMPCLVPYQKAVATMPNGFKGVNPDKKMNRMPEVRIIPLAER